MKTKLAFFRSDLERNKDIIMKGFVSKGITVALNVDTLDNIEELVIVTIRATNSRDVSLFSNCMFWIGRQVELQKEYGK